MKWSLFKRSGRTTTTPAASTPAAISPIEAFIATTAQTAAASAEQAPWQKLKTEHPAVFEVFQKIHNLCPELVPEITQRPDSGYGKEVCYALKHPQQGEYGPFPIRADLIGGEWRQAGTMMGAIGGDNEAAAQLLKFAERSGYINVVEKAGLAGTQYVLEAGEAITALRPTSTPPLRLVKGSQPTR